MNCMNSIIHEISKTDVSKLEIAGTLFMEYFMDLYKDVDPITLGINTCTRTYLANIFERTREEFLINGNLYAFLAYQDAMAVGFATCSLLEDKKTVLIRTLPVNLLCKDSEIEIRRQFLQYFKSKFSNVKKAVIMVRRANQAYQLFCVAAGFQENNTLFSNSEYLEKTYDKKWYNAYEYTFSTE